MVLAVTCYNVPKSNSLSEVEGLGLPSYNDYAHAQDFFEAVREASREAERTCERACLATARGPALRAARTTGEVHVLRLANGVDRRDVACA